jgi:hypothetical protein
LSPDPQQDPYKTGRYMLCGSGVKNTGVHRRGVLGHFRMILNYKKIKKSSKLQAPSSKLQASSFKQLDTILVIGYYRI